MPSKGGLQGLRILITAGPTREHLDPVRFLSNPSSGRMGYSLARACLERGAKVILVSGPVELQAPRGVRRLPVISAREMLVQCRREFRGCDVFIASAAVSDFRPAHTARHKRKKDGVGETLELRSNPDILRILSRGKGHRYLVGFAAETRDLLGYAWEKLHRKRLDLMVANWVSDGRGFSRATNSAMLLAPGCLPLELPEMEKLALARRIVARVVSDLKVRQRTLRRLEPQIQSRRRKRS